MSQVRGHLCAGCPRAAPGKPATALDALLGKAY